MTQIGERIIFAWPLLVAEILIFGTTAFALLLAPEPRAGSRPGYRTYRHCC